MLPLVALKGIVSRKFDMLFWCRWIDKHFLHLFLFYPFFKVSSFACKIFEYKTFRGRFLLSHSAVNESCYVAQFVNSFVT
jgi:ABC-type microcin C transport system permease subunit YejB